jgi:flagellar basal-body rod modification protein FlgD
MNQTLDSELLLSESVHNALATTMIGRDVRVVGSVFTVGENGAVPKLLVQSPSTGEATVQVRDAAGDLVTSFNMQIDSTDPVAVEWDGKDGEGNLVAAGNYQFQVMLADYVEGDATPVTLVEDEVKTIRFLNGMTELLLDAAPYTLADVLEIRA